MTVRFALVTALLGTLALGSVTGGANVNAAQAAQQNPSAQGPANMQDMMKMHEQMMAEMKAGNAKLDALVRDMNAASGNAKINAVAVVVNELVQQHKAMHEHMGQMQMMGGRGMNDAAIESPVLPQGHDHRHLALTEAENDMQTSPEERASSENHRVRARYVPVDYLKSIQVK